MFGMVGGLDYENFRLVEFGHGPGVSGGVLVYILHVCPGLYNVYNFK